MPALSRPRHLALCDGYGSFSEPLERAFPGSGHAGPWLLHVHCHVLVIGSRVVLVDAGTGPPWAPAASWFSNSGMLPAELDRVGLRTTDVTDVVLTHLHVDHVGWIVHGDSSDPTPTFPNARHLVQRLELAVLSGGSTGQRGLFASHVQPLSDGGLLDPVDGATDVLPGVALVPAPGHTPGHQCVAVDLGDETLLISGDTFVHPMQVSDRARQYIYESDPSQAVRSRDAVLARAATERTLLAPAHFAATVAMLEITSTGARLVPRETCGHGAEQP